MPAALFAILAQRALDVEKASRPATKPTPARPTKEEQARLPVGARPIARPSVLWPKSSR
jgi:hypothetical protein